jgi:hypothetical protein
MSKNLKNLLSQIIGFGSVFITYDSYRRLINNQDVLQSQATLNKKQENLTELILQLEQKLDNIALSNNLSKEANTELIIKINDQIETLKSSKANVQNLKVGYEKYLNLKNECKDPDLLPDINNNLEIYRQAYQTAMEKFHDNLYNNNVNTIKNLEDTISKLETISKDISNKFLDGYFQNFQDFINTLNVIELGALLHIICNFIILFSLFNILTTILGLKIIEYFDLENKFPRIAKFLKFRASLQKFNITINIICITLAFFIPLYVDICVFFGFKF